MSLIYNGILYTELSELEAAIANLSDYQKQCLINDFNKVPNTPTVGIPQSVTNRQIRQALVVFSYQNNMPSLLPKNIKAAIEAMPDGIQKDIAFENWEYSNEFLRNNPLISSLAPTLGLTEELIDQLFIYASTL